jgi:diadenosine tetraphosphate (Ap4A) HIT family hydrolase
VIWKEKIEDITKLNSEDYEYLMDVVDVARDTLREFYTIEKVYLMYLDEAKWVHWHLIPRYDEKGFNLLKSKPVRIDNFNDAVQLTEMFKKNHNKMILEN